MCVVGDGLAAVGSAHVFEVHERFPSTCNTQRVSICLSEAVHEVHTAIEVFHPSDAVFVESAEVASFVELDHLLDDETLLVVLGERQCFLKMLNHMAKCFAVHTTYFIYALYHFAVLLHELAVETNPEWLCGVVFVCLVVCLCFSLGHTFVVVVSRREEQVFAVKTQTLWHYSWVEHHWQDSCVVGHACFSTRLDKPLLREFWLELVGSIVMVNTIGKPYAFEVFLEVKELSACLVALVLGVEGFECATDAQVVATVLIVEDITTVQSCFGEVINEGLLLQTQ